MSHALRLREHLNADKILIALGGSDGLSAIRERVELTIIVDADTGFGNALNVQRTVRLFERQGASAIQLEDQQLPKRCGHLAGKSLVSKAAMIGKLHAALDARQNTNTAIIARAPTALP